MGLFGDIANRFTHPDPKDRSWMFGHPGVALDTILDAERAKLSGREPLYAPPYVVELLERSGPDEFNARWSRINQAAEARLRNAGLNPAAAAAAAARVASEATREGLVSGSSQWQELMKAWQERVTDARKITTHEPHTAYTQGFLGVGGGQGVSNLLGGS